MFRELTYSDVSRARAITDAEAGFVMDEEAFRGFYDRNARGVWAYLSRVTGDRQLADDLLQEAFYRFLRAASTGPADVDRFDSEAHRRNSLYKIATNLVTDARRRSFTRPAAVVTGDDVERLSDARKMGGDHGSDVRDGPMWIARWRSCGRGIARCCGWRTPRALRMMRSQAPSVCGLRA